MRLENLYRMDLVPMKTGHCYTAIFLNPQPNLVLK
jgi:hypothetical protein